jgi:hypothetical protein
LLMDVLEVKIKDDKKERMLEDEEEFSRAWSKRVRGIELYENGLNYLFENWNFFLEEKVKSLFSCGRCCFLRVDFVLKQERSQWVIWWQSCNFFWIFWIKK